MRVICLLIQDGRFLHEIAEACYRLTPQVAIRENEAVFLEISRCGKIYSEDNLLLRLQALLKRFNVRARVAVADDCALSLCFARTNFKGYPPDRLSSARLPIEVLHDIASPFERDDLVFKQVEELIGVLKRLGIYDLGGFLALPVKSLASRFHSLGLILHHKLTAPDSHLSWPPFIPTEKIEEDAVIQDSENAHELEPLLFVIKNLAGRAMARLAGRGERVTKFQLALEQEKHSLIKKPRRVWEFILPLPQGSTSGLLPLIKERLQTDLQRDPLESWVNYIKILITETVPGQYGQRNFFNKKEEEQEAWSSLIARLCQKLGKDHAFAAAPVESFKPENAWKRDWPDGGPAKAFNQNLTIFPQRPLRVLKDPIRIFKSDNFLQDQTQRWEIKDWDGPERLSGEWWDDEFARDYFRIGTKQGEQLWVYRIPDSDQLFLHGYFD